MAMNRIVPAALVACACAAQQPKRLVVPDGMRKQTQTHALPRPDNTLATPSLQGALQPATSTSQAATAISRTTTPTPQAATSNSKATDGRYVLRLAEHNRVWELELPESAGGYEMRVPLDGPLDAPTAADTELFASARGADAEMSRDGRRALDVRARREMKDEIPVPAVAARTDAAAKLDASVKSDAAPSTDGFANRSLRKSYLGTLAKVREMYASRKYEMALVELVDLEPSYPNDERLQAMKGSLYLKLGKPQLARECWQKALALDPDDAAVAEALRTLKEE
jgi:tetratricopeptide (TPR) repeat protein